MQSAQDGTAEYATHGLDTRPTASIARETGAFFSKDKFVRVPLQMRGSLFSRQHSSASMIVSTRLTTPHVCFAKATAGISADLGCPWREHAEQMAHHKIDRGRGRDNGEPGPIRRPQPAVFRRAIGTPFSG